MSSIVIIAYVYIYLSTNMSDIYLQHIFKLACHIQLSVTKLCFETKSYIQVVNKLIITLTIKLTSLYSSANNTKAVIQKNLD